VPLRTTTRARPEDHRPRREAYIRSSGDAMTLMDCRACAAARPLDEYLGTRLHADGYRRAVLRRICRKCRAKQMARWRQRRRQAVRRYARAWRKLNPGAANAHSSRWRGKNPTKRAEIQKTYKQSQKAKRLARERREGRIARKLARPAPLPAWNTTSLCPRGGHPWPNEHACKGYDSLGCGHLPHHVHRSCSLHGTETVERTPA
jgi:hypothetical protein